MSDSDAFHVLARWRVRDGQMDAVSRLLPELVAATRREPGNRRYDVYQRGADELILVESYADRAAFDAHRQSSHFQRLVVAGIVPHLTEREVSEMAGLHV